MLNPTVPKPTVLNLTVLSTQLAGLRRHPGRGLLTGLSVLVAAFVVFATVLAYQITTQTFLNSFSDTTSGTAVVAEKPAGVTPAQLAKVRSVAGVTEATGRISGAIQVAGALDRRLDLDAGPAEGPLARWDLVDGSYPTGPDELAVSSTTAEQWSLQPGGRLRLMRSPDGMVVDALAPDAEKGAKSQSIIIPVTITGIVDSGAVNAAYAPDTTVAAILDQPFERVDIAGGSPEQLLQTISRELADASVRTGDQVREAEAREAVRQFDVVFAAIGAFLLIAVIAAGLVATSTFRIVFAQRLRQLALLRTIGGQQRQIGVALTLEGLITGLMAGTLGVAAAYLVVQVVVGVSGALGRTLAPSGFPLPAVGLTIAGAGLITLASVVAPALSASDVSPLQALRGADTTPAQPGIGLIRWLVGLTAAAAAAYLALTVFSSLPEPGQEYDGLEANLLRIVISGSLAFFGLIALGPILVRGLLTVVGRALSRVGPAGELAVESLRTSSRRAAAVMVVVALGVTLVTGTIVTAASVRATVDSSIAVQSPADFVIDTSEGAPSPAVLAQLAADPSLSDVTSYRTQPLEEGAESYTATDLDLTALPALDALNPATGSVEGGLEPGQAVISDRVSYQLGVGVGDELSNGLTVRAVMSGNAPLGTDLVVTAGDLDALGASSRPSGVLLNGDGEQAETRIRAILGPELAAGLSALGSADEPITSAVAKLFAAVLGLVGLTVVIALVGVATTMSLTVLERTREFGLLRALGLSRPGLRALIGTESGLYGLIGAVSGLALGIPYAWLSIAALHLNAPLKLPLAQLVAMSVLLMAVTVVAGLLPTRRAARVSPVTALGIGN